VGTQGKQPKVSTVCKVVSTQEQQITTLEIMSKSEAQIAIRPETREKLFEQKEGPNDTYDSVITRLLGE
jgi:hypothetical protein